MRTRHINRARLRARFLSIQAQDFIEEQPRQSDTTERFVFLSIQAQDFIEDEYPRSPAGKDGTFLSIQAQDFIEEEPEPPHCSTDAKNS